MSSDDHLAEAAELRQGVIRLARRMRSRRGPEALSPTKISVLSHLRRHGPTTPSSLSATEGHHIQSLTRILAEMQEAGLVSRVRDPADHRQSILDITAAGFDALARDVAQRDAWLALAMDGLTETERGVLRLAGRLMDRIADAPPER